MTEASGGSDLASLKSNAVRDGDDWILNGSKTFITNGHSADLVLVAARTDPEAKRGRGISLFGVEAGMEGLSRGRKLDKVGQDESDTAELSFSNVRVPGANLIGELNQGFIHMMNWLPQERLSNAIGNIAQAAQILDETLEYCKERKAFGQPIGSIQQVPARRALHEDRGHPRLPRQRRTRAHQTAAVRDRRGQDQVVVRRRTERRPGRLRPAVRRLRLHERIPGCPRLARRPGLQDLGRLQRNHEGTHRPRPRAVMVHGSRHQCPTTLIRHIV
jgi:hypothetical protein